MKHEFSRQIFKNIYIYIFKIKFHDKIFSLSRVVPCGQTDGRVDLTRPTDTSRNFAKAPNKSENSEFVCCVCVGCHTGD